MSKANLRVDWATHDAALYACKTWHYSQSLPIGKSIKVGAWEDGKFIGVVVFSMGANKEIGTPYGLTQTEVCELVRVALKSHVCPVSRIVALAIKMLSIKAPGIRLIVSYADSGQGHHGGIYQAGNWIFVGDSFSASILCPDGVLRHKRSASQKYGSQVGMKRIPTEAKHKYLMPLDAEIRSRVLPLARQYPKRPKQAMTAGQAEQRQCNADPGAPSIND